MTKKEILTLITEMYPIENSKSPHLLAFQVVEIVNKCCDYQEQQIKELKEALNKIENECDNQNPTHENIWRLATQALK